MMNAQTMQMMEKQIEAAFKRDGPFGMHQLNILKLILAVHPHVQTQAESDILHGILDAYLQPGSNRHNEGQCVSRDFDQLMSMVPNGQWQEVSKHAHKKGQGHNWGRVFVTRKKTCKEAGATDGDSLEQGAPHETSTEGAPASDPTKAHQTFKPVGPAIAGKPKAYAKLCYDMTRVEAISRIQAHYRGQCTRKSVKRISSKPEASSTLTTLATEVIPSLLMDSGDASVVRGGVCGKRRVRSDVGELEEQQDKWARKRGAIVASTRTGEGFKLATGMQRSCLVDAGYNAMRTLKPEVEVSLPALRRKAIPELGNEREASWGSLAKALTDMGYPFEIIEATARFKTKGGPMLNLLKAKAGVFLVGLCVTVGISL